MPPPDPDAAWLPLIVLSMIVHRHCLVDEHAAARDDCANCR